MRRWTRRGAREILVTGAVAAGSGARRPPDPRQIRRGRPGRLRRRGPLASARDDRRIAGRGDVAGFVEQAADGAVAGAPLQVVHPGGPFEPAVTGRGVLAFARRSDALPLTHSGSLVTACQRHGPAVAAPGRRFQRGEGRRGEGQRQEGQRGERHRRCREPAARARSGEPAQQACEARLGDAEREGFEPSVTSRPQLLSREPHSSTLAPLRTAGALGRGGSGQVSRSERSTVTPDRRRAPCACRRCRRPAGRRGPGAPGRGRP